MSLRNEQYRSLKQSKEFLRLLLTKDRPKLVRDIKEQAYRCLRHFPGLDDNGKPMFSRDPFGPDEVGK